MAPDPTDGDARVEELLRVNAELAAEVRSLALDSGVRSSPVVAARRVARVLAELESVKEELERQVAATESARAELAATKAEVERLTGRADELQGEVTRLREGIGGLMRRARARLLRT